MKLIRKLKLSMRNIPPEEMAGLRQDNSSHPLNEELTRRIVNIHDEAASAYEVSQKISKDLQSVVDAAKVTIPLIPYMYPHQVEAIMPVWSSVGDQTIHIRRNIEEFSADSDAVGGTVSLTYVRTSAIFSPDESIPFLVETLHGHPTSGGNSIPPFFRLDFQFFHDGLSQGWQMSVTA